MNLNQEAARVHVANHKWWHDIDGRRLDRNPGEILALVNTEFAEAIEGFRKDCIDDHLPTRRMAEVELADALIRLLDFSAGRNVPIPGGHVIGTLDRSGNKAETVLEMMKEVGRIHDEALRGDVGRQGFYLRRLINSIHAFSYECGFDLWGAYEEKLAYNETREDHTHEARARAGGKAW